MTMRLSSGVGVSRNRLWMVRVVTSTREPPSGMKRRNRAMMWAGRAKGGPTFHQLGLGRQAVGTEQVSLPEAFMPRCGSPQEIWRGRLAKHHKSPVEWEFPGTAKELDKRAI